MSGREMERSEPPASPSVTMQYATSIPAFTQTATEPGHTEVDVVGVGAHHQDPLHALGLVEGNGRRDRCRRWPWRRSYRGPCAGFPHGSGRRTTGAPDPGTGVRRAVRDSGRPRCRVRRAPGAPPTMRNPATGRDRRRGCPPRPTTPPPTSSSTARTVSSTAPSVSDGASSAAKRRAVALPGERSRDRRAGDSGRRREHGHEHRRARIAERDPGTRRFGALCLVG